MQENGANTVPGLLATYGYDPLGRPTSETFGNGATISRGYNPDDLTGLTHTIPVAGYGVTFGTFGYNPAHQIVARPNTYGNYDFGEPRNGLGQRAFQPKSVVPKIDSGQLMDEAPHGLAREIRHHSRG